LEGSSEHSNGFHKMVGSSRVAAQLVVTMEFVSERYTSAFSLATSLSSFPPSFNANRLSKANSHSKFYVSNISTIFVHKVPRPMWKNEEQYMYVKKRQILNQSRNFMDKSCILTNIFTINIYKSLRT
jgi:hypothetical protein